MFHLNRIRSIALAAGLIIVAVSIIGLRPTAVVQADTARQAGPTPANGWPVAIYFFWGDGCPHCAAAKPFLEELGRQYPNVEVRAYEVWHNEANQQLLSRMASAFGFEPSAVPTIFMGDRYWIGYSDGIRDEITAAVATCSGTGCRDAGLDIVPGIPTPSPTSEAASPESGDAQTSTPRLGSGDTLTIPLIGKVDLTAQSLALSTMLIAFVDGFNPCSLWALSVLLALTLHSGSRKKVLLVGIVFLTVTSLVYMLFITGLFTMFTVVSFVGWIQVAVALVALFFAAVNIKDYFWYKEGISFTIADEKKPGIYKGMRRILEAGDSTPAVIGATVVLSAGVSLVEFSCTAGFPVLWTNLLISQQAAALTFVLLLLLYMLIYQIDELGIFLFAVFTLKAGKLEEKHGRILKLVGGMLMLTLAVVMLVNPAWMNQIGTSLIVFLIAFGLSGLTLALHRQILPRFGVYIGSELAAPTRKKKLQRQHSRRG
jgi:glutaredoxin